MFDNYEAIFARRADSYQRAMAEFPHARDAEFALVVDPLDPGPATVFDMPAGAGYLRAYLPADKRYVAVEPVGYFFDRCPTDPDAGRIQSPVEAVDARDGSADAIVSLAGLHHAPDLLAIFRECYRLLRPGGMLVVADVAEGSPPDRFLNIYVHENNPTGHEGRFLDDATAPLLREAGFGIVGDALVPVPWRFAGAADAGSYCASLFGIEGRDPVEVADAMTKIVGTAADAGGFRVDWSLRRIICCKD